jgi:hypothetical protein
MNREFTFDKAKKSDEFYTLPYAVKPLLKYIPKDKTIWCPFDKEESAFVRVFKENGYNVLFSHIDNEQDFFEYEPKQNYDYIISNPPYSLRTAIMQRLYFNLRKPFALLINESGLFDTKKRYEMLKTKDFEMMIFDKRVHYEKDGIVKKQEPFKSIYLCSQILPEKIVFETL